MSRNGQKSVEGANEMIIRHGACDFPSAWDVLERIKILYAMQGNGV